MRYKLALAVLLGAIIFNTWGAALWACSSCGTGGDDPLILYPNESYKLYLGSSYYSDFRSVSITGEVIDSSLVESRWRHFLALGLRLSERSFVTIGLPYIENIGQNSRYAATGDPVISGRYTAVRQNIVTPWIPQVQLMAGYSHKASRGSADSRRLEDLLDVTGQGYSRGRLGIDIWWAMFPVVFGASSNVLHTFTEHEQYGKAALGREYVHNITVGWSQGPLRLLTGVVRQDRGDRVSEGKKVPRSHVMTHSIFLSGAYKIRQNEVKLIITQAGHAFKNRQTSQSTGVTMAWLRAW